MRALSITAGENHFDRKRVILWAGALLVLSLVHRVTDLDTFVNVDAYGFWFERTAAFWTAVEAGDWKGTFQSPHPGVPVMWLSGAGLKLANQLTGKATVEALIPSALPLAVLNSFLAPGTFLLLLRLCGRSAGWFALMAGLLMAFEPQFVAHSRYFHLDMTATTLSWFAILSCAISVSDKSKAWALVSGVFFGLAVTTRMSVVVVGFGALLIYALNFRHSRDHKLSTLVLITGIGATATAVLVWPGLLFAPAYVIQQLVGKTERWVAEGHQVFSWGKVYLTDPGFEHYFGIILMKTTPEVLLFSAPGLLALLSWDRQRRRRLLPLLLIYLPLIVLLGLSTKKIGRYLLPFFPLLCLLAAAGLVATGNAIHRKLQRHLAQVPIRASQVVAGLVFLLCVGRAARVQAMHPHPGTYCATAYPGLRCEEIMTLGFGQGMREAALWIAQNTPRPRPRIFVPMHGGAMRPWLAYDSVNDILEADFVVLNLSAHQRRVAYSTLRKYTLHLKPSFEIVLSGNPYAQVYVGPAHPDYPGRASKKP